MPANEEICRAVERNFHFLLTLSTLGHLLSRVSKLSSANHSINKVMIKTKEQKYIIGRRIVTSLRVIYFFLNMQGLEFCSRRD